MVLSLISIWFAQVAPTSGSDATALVTQLGAFGSAALALYLWQRDTGKQRDRAMAVVEQQTPILVEMRDVMRSASENLRATASAMEAMSKLFERVPSEAEITRMRDALAIVEKRLQ